MKMPCLIKIAGCFRQLWLKAVNHNRPA